MRCEMRARKRPSMNQLWVVSETAEALVCVRCATSERDGDRQHQSDAYGSFWDLASCIDPAVRTELSLSNIISHHPHHHHQHRLQQLHFPEMLRFRNTHVLYNVGFFIPCPCLGPGPLCFAVAFGYRHAETMRPGERKREGREKGAGGRNLPCPFLLPAL